MGANRDEQTRMCSLVPFQGIIANVSYDCHCTVPKTKANTHLSCGSHLVARLQRFHVVNAPSKSNGNERRTYIVGKRGGGGVT